MVNVLLVEDSKINPKITRDLVESSIAGSQDYMLIASLENAANAEIVCMRGNVDRVQEHAPTGRGCGEQKADFAEVLI